MKAYGHYIAFGRPSFDETDIESVARVMRSGWVGMGNVTLEFEKDLATFLGVGHVISVNSCTSALHLSLLALGVGEGNEVVVPSLTWCATANAVLYTGATIRFCDVDQSTMSMSIDSLRGVITDKTKAVIPVHYGGRAVDILKMRESIPNTVAIVEDAAHAFGAAHQRGDLVGSLGNIACFSFYANKNISTGEGGAIATNDSVIAERLRTLRLNGLDSSSFKRFTDPNQPPTPEVMSLGYKMNYFDLLAAIGQSQLKRFTSLMKRRQLIAEIYADVIEREKLPVEMQTNLMDFGHALHLFPVLIHNSPRGKRRDRILTDMRKMNIGATVHYKPLHQHEFYKSLVPQTDLPNTEYVGDSVLTLPISASITEDEARFVAKGLKSALHLSDRE